MGQLHSIRNDEESAISRWSHLSYRICRSTFGALFPPLFFDIKMEGRMFQLVSTEMHRHPLKRWKSILWAICTILTTFLIMISSLYVLLTSSIPSSGRKMEEEQMGLVRVVAAITVFVTGLMMILQTVGIWRNWDCVPYLNAFISNDVSDRFGFLRDNARRFALARSLPYTNLDAFTFSNNDRFRFQRDTSKFDLGGILLVQLIAGEVVIALSLSLVSTLEGINPVWCLIEDLFSGASTQLLFLVSFLTLQVFSIEVGRIIFLNACLLLFVF